MVHHITNVIKEYHENLREIPYIPKTSYQRDSLGYCGDANKTFLTFLFRYKIGGPAKTVQIEVGKFGRQKYQEETLLRAGGCLAMLNVSPVRPLLPHWAEPSTLTNVISAWIEPCTTLLSDWWAAYWDIRSVGYTHRNVNYSVSHQSGHRGSY
jgi:hypothetical protein